MFEQQQWLLRLMPAVHAGTGLPFSVTTFVVSYGKIRARLVQNTTASFLTPDHFVLSFFLGGTNLFFLWWCWVPLTFGRHELQQQQLDRRPSERRGMSQRRSPSVKI